MTAAAARGFRRGVRAQPDACDRRVAHRPLSRLLFALGIRHVGVHAAQVLAREFVRWTRCMAGGHRTLAAVHGIGLVTAAGGSTRS
jgi:hypothetical protein